MSCIAFRTSVLMLWFLFVILCFVGARGLCGNEKMTISSFWVLRPWIISATGNLIN